MEQIEQLKAERDAMKARAVAFLDLLDDIHQSEETTMPDELYQRLTDTLNSSTWVDD